MPHCVGEDVRACRLPAVGGVVRRVEIVAMINQTRGATVERGHDYNVICIYMYIKILSYMTLYLCFNTMSCTFQETD